MPSEKWTDKALSAITDEDSLKLENQIAFELYVCSKEIIKKYKPLLEPYDLTYTGYITLAALWEKDAVNVKELGKRLYLDSGTLTPLLKKLEAQEYVERKRDPADERNMIIVLTEKGKALKKDLANIPRQAVEDVSLGSVRSIALSQILHQLMKEFSKEEGNIGG